MEPLTPQELEELRKMIEDDRLTETDKDDLIRTVDHIVQSFILAAHGLGSVELSLSARANARFQNPQDHANLEKPKQNERIDLDEHHAVGGQLRVSQKSQSPDDRLRRPEEP